jgi:hypothetical protein
MEASYVNCPDHVLCVDKCVNNEAIGIGRT